MSSGNNVRVVCRFRPQNNREIEESGKEIIQVDDSGTMVHIKGRESDHKFNFDRIFPPSASQATVYDESARPVVEDIMKGYNGTIFVYGQTGSGKTHTMQVFTFLIAFFFFSTTNMNEFSSEKTPFCCTISVVVFFLQKM